MLTVENDHYNLLYSIIFGLYDCVRIYYIAVERERERWFWFDYKIIALQLEQQVRLYHLCPTLQHQLAP